MGMIPAGGVEGRYIGDEVTPGHLWCVSLDQADVPGSSEHADKLPCIFCLMVVEGAVSSARRRRWLGCPLCSECVERRRAGNMSGWIRAVMGAPPFLPFGHPIPCLACGLFWVAIVPSSFLLFLFLPLW